MEEIINATSKLKKEKGNGPVGIENEAWIHRKKEVMEVK